MKIDTFELRNKGDYPIGPSKAVIAGPCSAETEEQVMATATALQRLGVAAFRAGIWKPRTRPGCFEGVGTLGLAWMRRVQRELDMPVIIEVGNARHVEQALAAGIDMVWLGARTTANPFAVQEIADALKGTDIPVFVKNPINADLELWIGAFERLNRNGISRLAAVLRGFSSYEKTLYRYPPQWQIAIELRRRVPDLPLFCDPSHITGRRDLVPSVCHQAMDLGFDGLMIECHNNPDAAWSDAAQQVTPDALHALLSTLDVRSHTLAGDLFNRYRSRIDDLDAAIVNLLAERMAISRNMGQLKREQGVLVLQADRYNNILSSIEASGVAKGLSAEFLHKIFESIHAESIAQQLDKDD
jgi:chorismate mutase